MILELNCLQCCPRYCRRSRHLQPDFVNVTITCVTTVVTNIAVEIIVNILSVFATEIVVGFIVVAISALLATRLLSTLRLS